MKLVLMFVSVWVLYASSVSAALCEGEWWIDSYGNHFALYEKPDMSAAVVMQGKPEFGTLSGYADPPDKVFCRLVLEGGRTVYIREDDILASYPGVMRKSEKLVLVKKEQELLELQKKKDVAKAHKIRKLEKISRIEARSIIATLNYAGIRKGQRLWPTYPVYDLDVFDRISVKNVSVTADIIGKNGQCSEIDCSDMYYRNRVLVSFESDGKERVLDISDDIETVGRIFTRNNPTKGWSRQVMEAVRNGSVIPGMTREQVQASIGLPERISRSTRKRSYEQWTYSSFSVNLENGKVTGW